MHCNWVMALNSLQFEQKWETNIDTKLLYETSRYVFRIIVIKEIMENARKYGFVFRQNDLYSYPAVKQIRVDSTINNLYSFAEANDVNYKILKRFNPWLRTSKLPDESRRVYYIDIPEKTEELIFDDLAIETAKLIREGNIVGWVQGRMEFGPRALGNRSILGDARNPEMQKKLNLKIKFRESFRPFAPSVLWEDCTDYFEQDKPSPYMLLVQPVVEKRRNKIPDDYAEQNLRDKLYFERSDIPAVTHVDFSARIQTVHHETNPKYHKLISEFKKLTGYGLIVNTSFNVRGEPIVCTAEDAYRCFMRTEMDYLVIGNYLFNKKQQPNWNNTDNWKEEFVLD